MGGKSWLRSVLRVIVCWAVISGFAGLAEGTEIHEAIDGIYAGTIGRQAVVVELEGVLKSEHGENYADPYDKQTYPISGFYFYRRHGVSIDLVGMPSADGSLLLKEYRQPVRYEFTAEWQITIKGDAIEGTFCRCDGSHDSQLEKAKFPIRLKRLTRELPADTWEDYKPHSGDFYNDLLLDFPLRTGPEIKKTAEIAYQKWEDPRFKVDWPHLTRLPDTRVMARINADLVAEFTHSRLWAAGCLSGGQSTGTFGGSYEETASIDVFPPEILSVSIVRSWYCGAVHGDSDTYGLYYNLRTGRRFTLEHSFQTARGGIAKKDLAALFAQLYELHYVKPSGPVAPEDCDVVLRRITSDEVSLVEAFFPDKAQLLLSQKGLVFVPTFRYADSGCGPQVTIPYKELRRFVKPGSMLWRIVDAQRADPSSRQ